MMLLSKLNRGEKQPGGNNGSDFGMHPLGAISVITVKEPLAFHHLS